MPRRRPRPGDHYRPGVVAYICNNCGRLLGLVFYGVNDEFEKLYGYRIPSEYEGRKYGGLTTINEIVSQYGGRCPHCGAKLEAAPKALKATTLAKGREFLRKLLEDD